MKVLWFSNVPFPAVSYHFDIQNEVRGGWLPSLAKKLAEDEDIELGVAWAHGSIKRYEHFATENINYFVFPSKNAYKKKSPKAYSKEISYCLKAIDDFRADIVHVHGTENFYGLIGGRHPALTIISIQGIVNEIRRYFFGDLSLWQICRKPSYFNEYRQFCKRCPVELEIFRRNKIFTGRTFWDRSFAKSIQPDCQYFHENRVLRPIFYETQWVFKNCKKGNIYCTSSDRTYKGIDVLLKAVHIAKKTLPDIQVRIAGDISTSTAFGKYIHELIHKLDIVDNVMLLGVISDNKVADELLKANLYIMPSFIENNSNSLSEALLVGTPAIASYTGGLPDLIQDGVSGLFFPRGDFRVLAGQIVKLIEDEKLAINISTKARSTAIIRHKPEKIASTTKYIYKNIFSKQRG